MTVTKSGEEPAKAEQMEDFADAVGQDLRERLGAAHREAVSAVTSKPGYRGRGYLNLRYLRFKAQRMAITETEFKVLQKAV